MDKNLFAEKHAKNTERTLGENMNKSKSDA
jgi:hypothetical protein